MQTSRRFNLIWNVVKFLIAIVLVGYVFSKTDLNEFISLRDQMVLGYLVATFFLYALLTMFKAFVYHVLIQQDTQYLRVLNVVVLQNAVSNFFANGAGIASYLTMLKVEENVRVGRSGLVFLIIKIGDLFAVWFIMLVCGVIYWDRIAVLHQPFIFVELIVGMGFMFFFGTLFFRSLFISFFSKLMDRFRLTRFSVIQQSVQGFDAFAEMDPRTVFQTVLIAFGLSLSYYLLTLIWQVVSMYAFGFQAQIWVIVFVSGILQLFTLLPISIFGGIGLTEATALYLYPLFGVDVNGLSPILLGWRVLYYLTNLFVLIYLPFYTFFIASRMKLKDDSLSK
jgi:uncharacterized membrane protein YbhN (UPF0104 family)